LGWRRRPRRPLRRSAREAIDRIAMVGVIVSRLVLAAVVVVAASSSVRS